jgi:hypothetical protein
VFDDDGFEYPYGGGLDTFTVYPNATNATNCSNAAHDDAGPARCVDRGRAVNETRASRVPGGGAAAGGQELSLRGWGLCPNATYACRFLADDDDDDDDDPAAPTGRVAHWLDSGPAAVGGPQALACVTPPWGAHFADVATAVVLRVGNASANASAVAAGAGGAEPGRRGSTVGQSGTVPGVDQRSRARQELVTSVGALPFTFVCCVDVPLALQRPTYNASAEGGGAGRWRVLDWALPFETTLWSGGAQRSNATVSFSVPAAATNVTVVAPSAALLDAENVSFTVPAGVGWGLAGFVQFAHLPLLRFAAESALHYRRPEVTRLRRGDFNNTGPTAGNFSMAVLGRGFGGADFGQTVHFLGIGLDDADNACGSTQWVSDSKVVCNQAPAGSGSEMNVVVVAGNVYR